MVAANIRAKLAALEEGSLAELADLLKRLRNLGETIE
jgi:hypothetical protein